MKKILVIMLVLGLILAGGCARKPTKKKAPALVKEAFLPARPPIQIEERKIEREFPGLGRDDPFAAPIRISPLEEIAALPGRLPPRLPALKEETSFYLRGIFSDEKEIIAVLEGKEGKTYIVREGDFVRQGLKVEKITADSVILEENGKSFALPFP